MSPGNQPDIVDITNYTFHTSAAIGGRVAVRRIAPVGGGEQLRAAAQAYAHGIADLLAADDLAVAAADTLPSGAEYVTVTGRLPAEPGRAQGSMLRSAIVRLSDRDAVNVEFTAPMGEPQAEQQFREMLRTLRPTPAGTDPVVGAFESVAAASPRRTIGPVTLDLPTAFRGPSAAVFATADRRTRFEVAVAPPAPAAVQPALFGPLGVAMGDDGKAVRYELPPVHPPVAPESVTEEMQRGQHRIRVTGTVTGNTPATHSLVRNIVTRLQRDPN